MGQRFLKLASRIHVVLYRASGGRIGASLGQNVPVLLLPTTGGKSGKRRTNPLLYAEDAGRYVVVASVGGAPRHPAWYLNLRDHDAATIQVGSRTIEVHAATASPEERARLWPIMSAAYPGYDGYQAKTSREIPVVILTPAS